MPQQDTQEIALKKILEKTKRGGLFQEFDNEKHAECYKALAEYYRDNERYIEALNLLVEAFNDARLKVSHASLHKLFKEALTLGYQNFTLDELESLLKKFKPTTRTQRESFLKLFYKLTHRQSASQRINKYEWLLSQTFYKDFFSSKKEGIIQTLSEEYLHQKQYQKAIDLIDTLMIDTDDVHFIAKCHSNEFAALIIKSKLLRAFLNKSSENCNQCFDMLLEKRHINIDKDIELEGFPETGDVEGYKQALLVAQKLEIEIPFPIMPKQESKRYDEQVENVALSLEEVASPHGKEQVDFKILDFNFEKLGVVGYQHEIKTLIQKVFLRRLLPETIKQRLQLKPTKGVLLFGPPGTGKTLIARTVAQNYFDESQVIVVNGPELKSRFVGQSAQNLRSLFHVAQLNRDKTFIYIFDEIDAAFSKRSVEESTGTKVNNDLTSQFLTLLDGFDELANVIVIGTTNFKKNLDEALLRSGRLETHIPIGLPNLNDRKALFSFFMKPLIEEGIVDDLVDVSKLAYMAKGLSCADIKAIVDDVKDSLFDSLIDNYSDGFHFDESMDLSSLSLTMADFEQALIQLKLTRSELVSPSSFFKPQRVEEQPTLKRTNSCTF